MHTVKLSEFNDEVAIALPPEAAAIPSMMSREERQFIHGWTKNHYAGTGYIVDAGVFLGASTACFGAGLAANPRADEIRARLGKPIVTYEQAIVRENLQRTLNKYGVFVADGGSFLPALEKNIAPVAADIDLHIGDILQDAWDGRPIECLFLDILKTREIQNFVYQGFFPSLQVGGIVLQQDYFTDGAATLKMKQELLADYFDYLGEIYSTAVFRLRAPIPADQLAIDVTKHLDVDHRIALLQQASDRTEDADRHFFVELAKIGLLARERRLDDGRALWESTRERFPAQSSATNRRMTKALGKVRTALQLD